MSTPQRQPAATPPGGLTRAPVKPHPLAPPATRHAELIPATDADQAATRMLCARVPLKLHDDVKLLALRRHTSLQAIVTEALHAYVSE